MKNPATPPQMAANHMVATETVENDDISRPDRQSDALRHLLSTCEAALDHIDIQGQPAKDVEILLAWHDSLRALEEDISALLISRGSLPAEGGGLVEGVRSLLSKGGLPDVVKDGTRLLDLIADGIEAAAEPRIRDVLERQRARLVVGVNDAQDRLDA